VTDPATVVLVHGAWHGAWCWHRVLEALTVAGVPALALDLPGHGDSPERLGDLHGDAAAVRAALDGLHADGQRVVLVGHSYGGAVITAAGDHPAVEHLVYLAAFAIDADESVLGVSTAPDLEDRGDLPEAIRIHEDGTWTIDCDRATTAFYGDCRPEDIGAALLRLDAQPGLSLAQKPRAVAWRSKPATYVVCSLDRAIPPPLQRTMAARVGAVEEWESSHSPFLSMPDRVAELLVSLATSSTSDQPA
jgi:pimeloyl-ACP methyl ester carboxylesterase